MIMMICCWAVILIHIPCSHALFVSMKQPRQPRIVTSSSSFATRRSTTPAHSSSSQLRVAIAPPTAASTNYNDDDDETTAESSSAQKTKVGILLLNLGGPERSEDVEGFLYNLFADPDIIRLPALLSPLQSLIATVISKRRAPQSRQAYESIGGGSPILKYSTQQGELICQAIHRKYPNIMAKAYIGMRYWYPFTEEALQLMQKDNVDAIVILPLYPQFSISTSGSSLRVLQEEFSKNYQTFATHTVVPSWYSRPGYVRAMASLIMRELDSFTPAQIQEQQQANPQIATRHVLFSAHGVPRSYIEAGDPYQQQIVDCVDKIRQALPSNVQVHLSYQSRVGPIEWLRPYTDDVLPELAQQGVRNLVVVPISFVSEHIETLEEIDIEYRELAEESGITNWRRCPALNTDPAFIEDVADLVMESLMEPAQTVTEACVANNVGNVELQPTLDEQLEATGVQGVGGTGFAVMKKSGSNSSGSSTSSTSMGMTGLESRERLLARVAMAGLALTLLIEFLNGKPVVDFFRF